MRLVNEVLAVSIHAFRGEGDPTAMTSRCSGCLFQSTPSGGKATRVLTVDLDYGAVSIHAFRGEGDGFVFSMFSTPRRFNPRLPGGRRREAVSVVTVLKVSIHAFRGEGDRRQASV